LTANRATEAAFPRKQISLKPPFHILLLRDLVMRLSPSHEVRVSVPGNYIRQM